MCPNSASTPRRGFYAFSVAATVGVGLVWRSHLLPLSGFTKKYGGDALWALSLFFFIRFLRPRMNVARSASVAFAVAVVVEVSQLYHAPWVDLIRGTRLGVLILGSTFNWPDIADYAAGILVGALFDRLGQRIKRRQHRSEVDDFVGGSL